MKPVFVSYRRTRIAEVSELAKACRFRGLPVFVDLSDPSQLAGQGQYDRLRAIIAEDSSGIFLYVTKDIAESPTIWKVEIPTALSRLDETLDYPIIPIFRDMRPESVRDSMPPHGQRIASLAGVVSLPPKGLNDAEVSAHLRKQHVEAARMMLDLLLRGCISADPTGSFRLGIRTRDVGPSDEEAELVLDWRDGYSNDVPSGEICTALHTAATDVASALSQAGRRNLKIVGEAHLSAAVMLGSAFAQTTGFGLSVGQYGEWWTSGGAVEEIPLDISSSQLDPSISDVFLAVAISRPEVVRSAEKAIGDLGLMCGGRLVVRPQGGAHRRALKSGEQARAVVDSVVDALMVSRSTWGAGPVHLFLSAPFAFAVLLGHNLNALGPVHVYEYDKTADTYHKAFVLP